MHFEMFSLGINHDSSVFLSFCVMNRVSKYFRKCFIKNLLPEANKPFYILETCCQNEPANKGQYVKLNIQDDSQEDVGSGWDEDDADWEKW